MNEIFIQYSTKTAMIAAMTKFTVFGLMKEGNLTLYITNASTVKVTIAEPTSVTKNSRRNGRTAVACRN